MSRKYQSRRKGQKQTSSSQVSAQPDHPNGISATTRNANHQSTTSPVAIRRYYRKAKHSSHDHEDSKHGQKQHASSRNQAATHDSTSNNSDDVQEAGADKENKVFSITKHYKKMDAAKFADCQQSVIIRAESVDTTTSYLSGLSLRNTPPDSINTDNIKQQQMSKAYRSRKKQQQHHQSHERETEETEIVKDDELTLDDICNEHVDVDEQLFDPASLPTEYPTPEYPESDEDIDEWPSWVPKAMRKRPPPVVDSPSKKRKRNGLNSECDMNGSPPSKKPKSPERLNQNNNANLRQQQQQQRQQNKITEAWTRGKAVFSTVRKSNKRRARRRSSLDHASDVEVSADESHVQSNIITPVHPTRRSKTEAKSIYEMETPIGSIRSQRIHRLSRKSNTDLLMEVLLRADNGQCPQMNHIKQQIENKKRTKKNKKQPQKLSVQELNGLRAIDKMDSFTERLCLHLLHLGADALQLNSDGMSAIYIAMHYKNSYSVIAAMIDATALEDYEELNQTYVFAEHGTMSLMDIALRIGDAKIVGLLLQHNLMPTRHSMDNEPKVELCAFCREHRLSKLAARVLKEQLFDAVENLDIEYIESILCHGIDINAKVQGSKSSLYYLVQQAFDIYDELDAKDQYDTIACLLRHGADPNLLDASKTPMLTYPIQRSGTWNIKLVDVLLSHGASLKLKVGETCKTLYCYAKQNCVCDEILNLITNYYRNNNNNNAKSKKRTKKKEKVIQLDVTTNPQLMSAIETNGVCVSSRKYSRNRKSAK